MGKRPKHKTTIEIQIEDRMELRKQGMKGETYSEIIRRLIQEAHNSSNKSSKKKKG